MTPRSQELIGKLDEVLALYSAAAKDDGEFEFYPHHFDDWKNGYAPFLAAACNLLRQHGPAIRAALAGDGFVLVPREPSEAMLDGAVQASIEAEAVYDDNRGPEVWEKFGLRKNRIRHQYAALLAAANQPAGSVS